MNVKERKVYENMVLAEKNGNVKKTAQGRPVAEEMAEAAAKHQQQEDMQRDISSFVENLVMNGEEELVNTSFFTMHMNALAFDLHKQACPAEIALCEFNIKDGIISTFHSLIRTRPIPIGYAADARDIIEKTHGLPWLDSENVEGQETDAKRLYVKILKFFHLVPSEMHEGAVNLTKFRKLPMLFTTATEFESNEILEACFKSIIIDAGVDEFPIKIYSVEELCQVLHTACVEHGSTASVYNTNLLGNKGQSLLLFKTDPYSQADGITCDYHEDINKRAYCSLSKAKRWSFMVIEYCCYLVGVKPKRNKHLPINIELRLYKNPYEKLYGKMKTDIDSNSSQCSSIQEFSSKEEEAVGKNQSKIFENSFDFEPVNMEISAPSSKRYCQSDVVSHRSRDEVDRVSFNGLRSRPAVSCVRQPMQEEEVVSGKYRNQCRSMEQNQFRSPTDSATFDMKHFDAHLPYAGSRHDRFTPVDCYTEKSMTISTGGQFQESERRSGYRTYRQENIMDMPITSAPYGEGASAMCNRYPDARVNERSTPSSYYSEIRGQECRKLNAPPTHSLQHFSGHRGPRDVYPLAVHQHGEYDGPPMYQSKSNGPHQQSRQLGMGLVRGVAPARHGYRPESASRPIYYAEDDELSYDDDSSHLRPPLRPIPVRGGVRRGSFFKPQASSSRYGDDYDYDRESNCRSTNPYRSTYEKRCFSDASSINGH